MSQEGRVQISKMPLPMTPPSLCFDREEFMKEKFCVDDFISHHRHQVQLEVLRDDLGVYLKVLRSAMIELINKDYADFVNLSTNLVGMDKALENLRIPLGQLKEEVLDVRRSLDTTLAQIRGQLAKRQTLRERKKHLQRLQQIQHCLDKVERLLGISQSSTCGEQPGFDLSSELVERVAVEVNQLQFHVTHCKGAALVQQVQHRIAYISTILEHSLERTFIDSLQTSNKKSLKRCLRIYATIDKMSDVEEKFRRRIVRPYLNDVICESSLQTDPQGLKGIFARVIEFVPSHCNILKEVTLSSKSSDVVHGYNFLVNAVWPEIVTGLEERLPSIFAPGNPLTFHEKYCTSMCFLERFEQLCGYQDSVRQLRNHPSYATFMGKWNLPVYFQIRFKEIGSVFESALCFPFQPSLCEKPRLHLFASQKLCECLQRCWVDEVYLPMLIHRFWKLTLQLISRYITWSKEVCNTQVPKPLPTKLTTSESCVSLVDLASAASPRHNGLDEQSVSTPGDGGVQLGNLVLLVGDIQTLVKHIPVFVEDIVGPRLDEIGMDNDDVLKASIQELCDELKLQIDPISSIITAELLARCSPALRQVNDTPRLYRRTNRDIPTKAATYVTLSLAPLTSFLDDHRDKVAQEQWETWAVNVLISLTEMYLGVTTDVLTSVQKMEESLKKLKKAKKGMDGVRGMTDDDKIRLQLAIDVQSYGKMIDKLGISCSSITSLSALTDLVENARISPPKS